MKTQGPLDENEKRRLVSKLVGQLRCQECGRIYEPHDFAVVHRSQDVWVLSTRCRHCDEPCHVVVFMRLDAASGPTTDLMPEELAATQKKPPLTADDVLDVHVFLEAFDGDFRAFFCE